MKLTTARKWRAKVGTWYNVGFIAAVLGYLFFNYTTGCVVAYILVSGCALYMLPKLHSEECARYEKEIAQLKQRRN